MTGKFGAPFGLVFVLHKKYSFSTLAYSHRRYVNFQLYFWCLESNGRAKH